MTSPPWPAGCDRAQLGADIQELWDQGRTSAQIARILGLNSSKLVRDLKHWLCECGSEKDSCDAEACERCERSTMAHAFDRRRAAHNRVLRCGVKDPSGIVNAAQIRQRCSEFFISRALDPFEFNPSDA